ncbi:tripartite tricarboxylate transporter TctB family protein [bacterium]|nr:tripartite tricarboxylate transporter TctB family protein [bacterium]
MVKEMTVSGLIIALSIFFYTQTFDFQTLSDIGKMGPEFWPRLNLIGIILLSLFIMLQFYRDHKKGLIPESKVMEKKNTKGVLLCLGILFSLIFLMPYFGFLPAAFLAMVALVYAFGERDRRVIFFTSFLLVAMIYIVFGRLMSVPLPRGILFFQTFSYYLY